MGDDNLQRVALQRCGGRGALDCVGGRADDVEHQLVVGEHGDVAAVDVIGGGAHELGDKALELRMDGAVVVGRDVPAGLRSPRDPLGVVGEQVGGGRVVGRPDELLLRLGEVAGEAFDPSGSIQMRPSATSMCAKTSVVGNWSCRLWEVSLASGASAAM
jgi:hypothetical protein